MTKKQQMENMQKSKFYGLLRQFVENNWILILIAAIGLFLRLYKGREMFMYNHDQDLAGWIIKDVIVNHHFRLIGQLTSTPGIFIGPYFYYLLIPFYLLFKMDPFGGFYLVVLIGLLTIWSFYFVLSKVFNKNTGLIGAFIYAISICTVMNDRWMVPTMPVFLWSVWMFYTLYLLLNGKKRGYVLAGVLVGLIWNLNFALVLTIPLLFFAVIFSKKKIDPKDLMRGIVSLVLTSLPLIIFETRHDFIQVRAFITALVTKQSTVLGFTQRFEKTVYSVGLIMKSLILGSDVKISYVLVVLTVLLGFVYLVISKAMKKQLSVLMVLWTIFYVGFFSVYSKILSEYYLNGMVVLWIIVVSLLFDKLLVSRKRYVILVLVLVLFSCFHFRNLFNYNTDHSGYVERRKIVEYINRDRQFHNYPCVAISYVTDPGYELGYRYLFWLEDMHIEKPANGSPVYSIVFPLSKVDKVDKYFGALGLILPDYVEYKEDEVKKVCSGQNSNLTDPMFGYTE
jgi:4-amino-4-deoxy-L-arabinose transferase-like glycosyltransferase